MELEQGRSLRRKHNNFKEDCWALLILVVMVALYYYLK